ERECARGPSVGDRPVVVIEETDAANLKWTLVPTVTPSHAAVVRHDVQAVLAVDGRIDRANRFARRVLAMLARHRPMRDFGILGPLSTVLAVRFAAGIIAINPEPVHDSTVRHL